MHRGSRPVPFVIALAFIISLVLALAGLVSARHARAQAGTEPDIATVTILLLGLGGVDYSVAEADLKQWLDDREFTSYPTLAEALLIVLDGKRLVQPVYLDVIVYKYEQTAATPSPRTITEVDFPALRAAVVAAYNERYFQTVTDFDSLLQ